MTHSYVPTRQLRELTILETVLAADYIGPMSKNYIKHDEVDSASTVWSPCGEQGMLNIKSEVRISPMDTTTMNLLTMDSFDSKL